VRQFNAEERFRRLFRPTNLGGCGTEDGGFFDALVRPVRAGLKYVQALLASQRATFIARLDRLRHLGQNVGWGVGDDFDHFWTEAGLASE